MTLKFTGIGEFAEDKVHHGPFYFVFIG